MSGGRWGAVRSFTIQLAGLAITAVLARLLTEEDFGLVAITVIVVAMFDLLTRVGFAASVIRRHELTPRIVSTFFWASLGLGLLASALAVAFSEPVARLAGSAEAAPLVAVAALAIPVNLAGRVPTRLLERELRFRAVAVVEIVATAIYGVVGILLALAGFGAWAVVIGQAARQLSLLVGVVAVSGFRPGFEFDSAVIREDLSFNMGLMGIDLVVYANKNVDYWFVGNRLGTAELGVYYIAFVIPNLLRQRITTVGQQVLFPVAARIRDDLGRTVAAYLRVVRLMAFLVVPAMAGLAVVPDLAIAIGFGPQWTEAVDPLRIFAISAALISLSVAGGPLLAAIGRPGSRMMAGLVSLLVMVIGLSFSWNGGSLVAVAFAVLAAALADGVVLQILLKRFFGVRIRDLVQAVLPFAFGSIVMAAVVVGFREVAPSDLGIVIEAAASVALGAASYLLVGLALFNRSFREQLRESRKVLGLGPRS